MNNNSINDDKPRDVTIKCPGCGSKSGFEIVKTDEAIYYKCKSCQNSYIDSKYKMLEYTTRRRMIQGEMKKDYDGGFGMNTDEEVKDEITRRHSATLDELHHTYPDKAENDPIFAWLKIQAFSRNFSFINGESYRKIQEYLSKAQNNKPLVEQDIGTYNEYVDRFNQYSSTLDNYIKEHTKKKKKKRAFIVSLVVFIVVAFIVFGVIIKFAPEKLFGENTIEYYVEGDRNVTNAVYSQKVEIEIPQKEGYVFSGLYTEENGGQLFVDCDGISVKRWNNLTRNKTYTFYARFKPAEYTVRFDANGGKGKMDVQRFTYDESQKLAANRYSREGYTFSGWYTDLSSPIIENGGMVKNLTTKDKGLVTLFAKWSGVQYTVTYNLSSGETIDSYSSNVVYGEQSELEVPRKDGYVFVGWKLNDELITDGNGKLYRGWSQSKNGLVLKAEWKIKKITISFANCNSLTPLVLDYNSTAKLPTPTRYKYDTFNGWYLGSEQVFDGMTVPKDDITLTADWDTNGWTYISDNGDMLNIVTAKNAKYCLINDIDLGSNWIPLCSYSWSHSSSSDSPEEPFTGVFDGDNHIITYELIIDNLKRELDYGFGLFGSAKSARFENIKLNSKIKCYRHAKKAVDCRECSNGALVGYAYNCSFDNCCTLSDSLVENIDTDCPYFLVGMIDTGATYAGGLVGDARKCYFNLCSNAASVSTLGYQAYSGGIAGSAYECNISCSFSENNTNSGTISASNGDWIWGEHSSGKIVGKDISPYKRIDGGKIS